MCCNGVRAIALVVLLLGLPRAHAALCPETVVIGYPAGRWPIAALGQDGPDGISAGYLQQLSAHGVTFSLRPLHGSAGAAAADGLQGLIGWPRTEVPHGWLASQPYLQLPQVIVRRRDAVPLIDLGGLHGQRVATLAPNTLAGPLHAQARGAHLLPMADIDRALDLLDSGTVDAVVANLAEAEAGLRRRGDDRLHVAAPAGLDSSFVLAAPPACASQVYAFNDLLQAMPAQQQLALLQAGRTPSAARIAAETPLLRGGRP
ncbi:MAG: hypothetical protein GAK31_03468 [Stenotrophomonas maltophilia]|uniref:Transporter substrate-binding domain-containing protein n=1 Tax=Stenotrophomonas maltophilia TaxID=40324 RepID=A0A7V8FDM8_STEMA|nr:MAG: hypothetical protein GAK31_03468 [Stenotrophomonas maltophilia]